MTAAGLMAAPFPEPPGRHRRLLDELRLAAAATDETEHESRRVAMLPRPWDPPSCPPEIRRTSTLWLDDVVAWINEEHTWRTDRVIPICWDCTRTSFTSSRRSPACAGRRRSPSPRAALEEWHRYTLPMFLDRVVERIGETGCPPDRHQPNPVAAGTRSTGRRRTRSTQESTLAGRGAGPRGATGRRARPLLSAWAKRRHLVSPSPESSLNGGGGSSLSWSWSWSSLPV